MRKLIVAGIAFVLLVGGFIVYMEIDKKKFIDSISSVSPVVNQPVNVLETTREVTQANEEPKFQEVEPDELLAAVRRIPEQFGYSEAATTYAELQAKRLSGEKLTIDESVARLEAALYLWPNEATRKTLILEKFVQSKGPNFHPRDGFSDEDIAKLKELGIPVVWRGNMMIIGTSPDHIRKEREKELRKKYAHILNDPKYFPSDVPATDSISSRSIDEDTVTPPDRPQMLPVISEPHALETPGHVHQDEGHIHEPLTIQPPRPTDAKSVEADGWEGLSPKQREQAKQLFDQYGTEEGLRRLREMAPDTAERFEADKSRPPSREQAGQKRRPAPSRDVSDGGQAESGSKD